MTTVEGRTREALHDVADGLDVTDADVARMEADLRAAIADPRRVGGSHGTVARRRRWALAAAAVAATVAVASGLALSADDGRGPERPAGAPATDLPLAPPDLVGLWRNVPDSPWVWEISANGRIGWTSTATGYLAGETVGGTIARRDGDVFTISEEGSACLSQLRIRTTSADAAEVTSMGDTCSSDEPESAPLNLERLTPGPVGPRALLHPRSFTQYPNLPITAVGAMAGSWFHAESGTLLVVAPPDEGSLFSYVMDDDGDGTTDPDQRGLVSVDAAGALDVRPFATDEVACVPRFTGLSTDNITLTTTSGAGGCFPVGSVQTWVRLN